MRSQPALFAVLLAAAAIAVASASAGQGSDAMLLQARSRRAVDVGDDAQKELDAKLKRKKELQDAIAKVNEENKNILSQVDTLEKSFTEASEKAKNDPKEREKHQLRNSVSQLKSDLKTVMAEIVTLQNQVKVFGDEYTKVQGEFRDLNAKITDLTLDSNSQNRSATRLDDVLKERSKQVEAVRAEQRVADNDLRNITDANGLVESSLQKSIGAINGRASEIESEVEKLKSHLQELQQQVDSLLSDVTVLQQKLDAETERSRELGAEYERSVETRESVQESLEEHRRLFAEAQAGLAVAEESLGKLRNTTTALREEVQVLTEEYRHLTELRANATDEMDRLEANTDHLSVLVDEASGAIEMLHERVDKMTEAIDAERKDHDETEHAIEDTTKSIRRALKFLRAEADRRESAHERAKQTTAARFDLVRTVARLSVKVGPLGASGPDRMCPCALITVEEAEEAGLEEAEVKALAECQHECERRRFCGVQCKRNQAARAAAEKKAEALLAAEEAHHEAEVHHEAGGEAAGEHLTPLAAMAEEAKIAEAHHTEEDALKLAHATESAEERRIAAEATARKHQIAAEALEHAAQALATLSDAAGKGNLDEVGAVAREQVNNALHEAADAIDQAGTEAAKTIKPGKDGSEAARHHAAVSNQLVQAAAGIGKVAQSIIDGADVATLADAEREVVSALQRAADILDAAGADAVSTAAAEEAKLGADEDGEVQTEAERHYSDSAARAFAEAAKVLDKAATDAEQADVVKKAEELKSEHKSSADKIRAVAAMVEEAVAKARLSKQHELEAEADKAEVHEHIDAATGAGTDQLAKQEEDALSKVDAQIALAKSKAEADGLHIKEEIEKMAEATKQKLLEEAERKKREAEEALNQAHEEELENEIKAIPSPAPAVVVHQGLNVTEDQLGKLISDAVAKAQPSPEPEVHLDEEAAKAIEEASSVAHEASQVLHDANAHNVTVKEAAVHGSQVEPAGNASSIAAQAAADADAALAAVEDAAAQTVELQAGQNATITETSAGGDVEQTTVEAAFLQAEAASSRLLDHIGAMLRVSRAELLAGHDVAPHTTVASLIGPLSHRHSQRASRQAEQETLAPADPAAVVASEPASNASAPAAEATVAPANASTDAAAAAAPAAQSESTAADEAAAATAAVNNATSTAMGDAIAQAFGIGSSSSDSNATEAKDAQAAAQAAAQNATEAAVAVAVSNATEAPAVAQATENATMFLQTSERASRHNRHHHHRHLRHHVHVRGVTHETKEEMFHLLEDRSASRRLRASQDQSTLAPADASVAATTEAASNATTTATEAASNATTEAAAPAEETAAPVAASQNSTIDGKQIGRDIAVIAGLVDGTTPSTTTTTTTAAPAPAAANSSGNATTETVAAANSTFASQAEATKTAVGADGDGQNAQDAATQVAEHAAAMRFLERIVEKDQRLADLNEEAASLVQLLVRNRVRRAVVHSSSVLSAEAANDDLSPEDRAAIAKAELTGIIASLTKLEAELADAKKLTADYTKELNAKQAKKAEFDALSGEDVDSLKATLSTLDKAYNAQVSIKTDLTSSRDSTRSDLEAAQAKKRDAESKVEALTSAIDRFKKRQESTQAQIDRLKEEKNTIAANIEAARERAGNEKSAGLERKLELMKQEAHSKERRDEAFAVRNKLAETVKEQEGKVEAYKHQVADLEHHIEGAKENQTKISEKISEEVDRTAQLSEADSVARSKAEHAKELTDEAEQEEVETRAAMQDLEAIKQQMLEPQARLKADLARLRTSIQEHTVKRDELLHTAQSLDHELNDVRSHAGRLNATLVSLRDANGHLHSELRKRNSTAKHLSELVELNRHEAELANRVIADSKARIEMLEADLLRLQKMDKATADGLQASHGSLVLPVDSLSEEQAALTGNGMNQPGDEVSSADAESPADLAADAASKEADAKAEEAQLETEAEAATGTDEVQAEEKHREAGEKQAEAEVAAIEHAAEAEIHSEGLDEGVTDAAKSAVQTEEAAAMSTHEDDAHKAEEAAEAGAQADGAGDVASGLGEAIKEAEGA